MPFTPDGREFIKEYSVKKKKKQGQDERRMCLKQNKVEVVISQGIGTH